jgi:hypothetical protein
MACMTHECIATLDNGKRCDFFVMDNTRRGQPCPVHGWDYINHFCDEVPDHNDRRDDSDWDEKDRLGENE